MRDGDGHDPLRQLGERLEAARRKRGGEAGRAPQPGASGGGRGPPGVGRVGLELVVAAVAGLLLGIGIDRWFGTKPAATLILFFLGIAAGMVNVWRAVMGMGQAVGYRRANEKQARREDDED